MVADFGCGCGTLGLAAALLEAEYVNGSMFPPFCIPGFHFI